MNPSESPEVSVEILLALRRENDAVRLITERLRVKEMGPADHIRTKHEVKAFVESGHLTAAEALLKNAQARRGLGESIAIKVSQRQGQRMAD
ncbi:MAG: hypothetical protein PSV22_02920 [Pseudolabrys sp.]|nr:hypothetical protein [Pseudolabrys sp.]